MKLTVIGAGTIGAGVAYNTAIRGAVDEIVIVDLDEEKALGEAFDIEQAVAPINDTRVAAGTYEEAIDADIVAVTAGKPRQEGMTRTDLLEANAKVMAGIHEHDFNEDAVFVTTTNPMDVVNYTQHLLTGFPRERFVGFGGWLDSARFQSVLADYLDANPSAVTGHVIGEHGDSQVPVFSQVRHDGETVDIPQAEYDDLQEQIAQSAMDVISRKGFTQWAPTYGVSTIIEAIAADARTVIPCSAVLDGEYGCSDVSMGVPCVLGSDGIHEIREWDLSDWEQDRFAASAEKLQDLCAQAADLV